MRIQLLQLRHRECFGHHEAEQAQTEEEEEERGEWEREAAGSEEEEEEVGAGVEARGRCALRPSRNAPYAPRSFKEQASYPATSERTRERNRMNAPSAKCASPGKPNYVVSDSPMSHVLIVSDLALRTNRPAEGKPTARSISTNQLSCALRRHPSLSIYMFTVVVD